MPEYVETMVEWHCPQCCEKNFDFKDRGTHCAVCGRAVWVGNEDDQIWDQGWNVKMEPASSDAG